MAAAKGVRRSGLRVLIVGSGAREHALAWKCLQSPLVGRVYVAPGNGGTAQVAQNLPVPADDPAQLVRTARKQHVGLVVLGPESAVAAGVADAFRDAGIPVFGPGRDAGRIECSKVYAKELMHRAGIPNADWGAFSEPEPARRFARRFGGRVAVKADGLALGKGVIVCGTLEEAESAIDAMLVRHAFGRAGATVVIERRLEGAELSLFGITDGQRVLPLAPARDFKRAHEGDRGPNTGGMGAYSPPIGVDDGLVAQATEQVLRPAVRELARRGLDYRGVLYAGLMLTADGIRVLEFNARFGDPECQVVLPRLRSDLVPLMAAAAEGDLSAEPVMEWSPEAAVGVVVASGGYPDGYHTGFPIEGLGAVPRGVLAFHAGTRSVPGGGLVTCGGRVLTMVGLGADVERARLAALAGAVRVRFPGAFFRNDIAQEAVRG